MKGLVRRLRFDIGGARCLVVQISASSLVIASLVGLLSGPTAARRFADPDRPDDGVVRVMTLNIFYGGDELDLHTGSWCHRPGRLLGDARPGRRR